jgi:hypothetical protein
MQSISNTYEAYYKIRNLIVNYESINPLTMNELVRATLSAGSKLHTLSGFEFESQTSNGNNPAQYQALLQYNTANGSVTDVVGTFTTASTTPIILSRINKLCLTTLDNMTLIIKGMLSNNSGGVITASNIKLHYGDIEDYSLLTTVTVPANASKISTITEVGFKGETDSSFNPVDFKITLQVGTNTPVVITDNCHILNAGSYNQISIGNLSYTGELNKQSIVRYYGKLQNGYPANLWAKEYYVNYIVGSVTSNNYPQNVYIYNTLDKFTKCNVCNKLLLGSLIRINADGTGVFRYYDDFLTNLYTNVVSSANNLVWSQGQVIIGQNGQISYTFDIRYPIDGIPYLILNVISGNPQIKIAVNEAGATGQLYSIDENLPTIPAGSHLWNLYSLANCNLSESTNITIQILSPSGESCVIGSIFFWTATITVDAELPKIFKDKINKFKIDMTADALCLISLGIHDYKWGI